MFTLANATLPQAIALPTGVRLPVVEHGDPHGLPVLLLHGYTDSWHSFGRLLPVLRASLRAVAPSQRGHGDADRPESGYAMPDFSDDAAALLDALGIERAIVLGHSMGGAVAVRFALDHPDRVLGLVLVGAAPDWRTPAMLALAESVTALSDPIDRAFIRAFQCGTFTAPVPPSFLDLVVEESGKVPARVWQAALAGLIGANGRHELGRIAAPTMLVWGDHDDVVSRRDQDALLAAIPGSRLLVYPGIGHAPHWEAPEAFARDLADFARRCAPRAGG